MTKKIWTPEDVENYLQNQKQNGNKLQLPNDVYCTENFTWNEVLQVDDFFFEMPSLKILENLKSVTEVLQIYRYKFDKPIRINSGWRTPEKLNYLLREHERYKKTGKGLKNSPSTTSLHLEGLALDFTVIGMSQSEVQRIIDESFIGEEEFDSGYTHIGLTTFSEGYLKRNKLFKNSIYRNLNVENISIQYAKNEILNKRMDAETWAPLENHFKAEKNRELFGANKDLKEAVRSVMKTPVDNYLEQQKEQKMRTFEVSNKKEKEKNNLLKRLKELLQKLQLVLAAQQKANQDNTKLEQEKDNYVEYKNDNAIEDNSVTEPEDDGLVTIPDKYKDSTIHENSDSDILPNYEARTEAKIVETGETFSDSDNNAEEADINSEYLKPIELPEELQKSEKGTPTGGAADIEEIFETETDRIHEFAQKYSDPMFMEDLYSKIGLNGSLKDLIDKGLSYHYDRNEKLDEKLPPTERELRKLSREIEKINKTLEEMKEQLEYHEKVVDVYNCPELAEFYLERPVRNIFASILEDYCIMNGIEMSE